MKRAAPITGIRLAALASSDWCRVPIIVVAGLCTRGAARGDEIKTADAHHRQIKIVDYAYGQIRFREPSGDLAAVSIQDVAAMLVDTISGVNDLNQAELYVDKGQPDQAIVRYERAVRSTDGFWKALVRVRLIQACLRAGVLDKATVHWLELVKRDPALASELLPSSVPPTRTRAVSRAIADLQEAAKRSGDETARRLIHLFQYSIYRRLDDPLADELAVRIARDPLGGPVATAPAYRVKTDALRRVFELQRNRELLSRVDAALADCPQGCLPDLLLLKGEVLFETARKREDYVRSGWAFMRVPIHFPDDARSPEALVWAARVHEKLGALENAVELLRECLRNKSADARTRRLAEESLKRLTESTFDPPGSG